MKIIYFLMLICIIKCEIYTDSNTCNTRGSGCIKCTGTNPDECLVCIEGLKIKEFEGILINEDDLNNYEGKCIDGPDTYKLWQTLIVANTTLIEMNSIVNAKSGQKFINLYRQMFGFTKITPTLNTLQKVITASRIKSQLLKQLQKSLMPIREKVNATTLIYGIYTTLNIEYNLLKQLGFIPESLKESIKKDNELIIKTLEDLKTDFTNDYYIIQYGLKVLDFIMKYYKFNVLNLEHLSENVLDLLFKKEEEWGIYGGYFPNGKPSEVNHYVLELLEENHKEELYSENELNLIQNSIDSALRNLIIQYSGFNPTQLKYTINLDEYQLSYLLNSESISRTSLSTHSASLQFNKDYLQTLSEKNTIDEDEYKEMLLLILYKHVNPYGSNPDSKATFVSSVQGYKIRKEDNSNYVQTELEKIAVAQPLYFPTMLNLQLSFTHNTGIDNWQCLNYDTKLNQWKFISATSYQGLANITCQINTFGTMGYEKIIIENKKSWQNIALHCTWFWIAVVSFLVFIKLLCMDCCQKHSEENSQQFAAWTISMPISLLSSPNFGDLVYKALLMLVYFSTISIGVSYNIQENSDNKNEAWMDFYTAFRILIFAWILKYLFGSLKMIQKDCFQNQAPLSILLIIVYFVEMYYSQRELKPATNDRQDQYLLTIVVAVIMDLFIDLILAIALRKTLCKQIIGLLAYMKLGGFVTLDETYSFHSHRSHSKVSEESPMRNQLKQLC